MRLPNNGKCGLSHLYLWLMRQTKTEIADRKHVYPTLYIVGLVIAVLLFVPALLIAQKHQIGGLQQRIFYDFNNLSDVFKIPALIFTEAFGSGYPIALCILVPLVMKRFKLAWRFFFSVAGAGVVLEIAKKISNEPRPAALLHGQIHQRAVETGLNSFPSGHEAVATALALTLWLVLPKRWRWLAVAWIVLVGVSRIYLGVHTLNDVVGGFAIGLAAVCFVRLLPAAFAKRLQLDIDDLLLVRQSRAKSGDL
jgi:membrane-associated phospholipid phosphatase